MAKRRQFKILIIILSIAIVVAAAAAFTTYQWVQADNVKTDQSHELFISTGSDFNSLVQQLAQSDVLLNQSSFRRVAGWMNFGDDGVKSGRYVLEPDWNNRTIINTLRSGRQTPVRITINNARKIEDVAGQLTKYLEIDSARLTRYLVDPKTLGALKLEKEEIISLFIPNTYEVFWNIRPVDLVERMRDEHDRFWNAKNRRKKADALGLTTTEVYTLASIVEKETQALSERPTVAGLYINRLNRGIPLQADPTVVFAVGDFALRRVLNKHLAMDSPYNTYLNDGLPPGPIYMSAISSIDAVLDFEEHDYIYMCARPDDSGLHAFASTHSGHTRNANRYRRWLDQRGIK